MESFIHIVILATMSLLFLMVLLVIIEAIIKKQKIVGKASIPIVFFVMAKIFPFISFGFLLCKGLHIQISTLFNFPAYVDFIALGFLLLGLLLAELTSFKLKKDLVFGLSDSATHRLQTKGVYSISRHPFYIGFLLILISSVLFVPHIINIFIVAVTWLLHHFIMISEEEFLTARYGKVYKEYAQTVNRYLTIFKR